MPLSGETAALSPDVLDLTDPAVLKQVKTAMALAPFMMPFVFGEKADPDFNERFFEEPLWGRVSTKFARIWIDLYNETHPKAQLDGDALFVRPHLFPTVFGAQMILGMTGYPLNHQYDSYLPDLVSFYDVTTSGAAGSVKAPYFSEESLESGGKGLKASTIAWASCGLLSVVALGMFLTRRKKSR